MLYNNTLLYFSSQCLEYCLYGDTDDYTKLLQYASPLCPNMSITWLAKRSIISITYKTELVKDDSASNMSRPRSYTDTRKNTNTFLLMFKILIIVTLLFLTFIKDTLVIDIQFYITQYLHVSKYCHIFIVINSRNF